jgi:hypothetical protein
MLVFGDLLTETNHSRHALRRDLAPSELSSISPRGYKARSSRAMSGDDLGPCVKGVLVVA